MNRPLYPIIAIFIIINIAIFIFSKALVSIGFDIPFLLGSNAVIFLLTVFGFALQAKGSRSSNVNAFIRGAAFELARDGITVNGVEPGFIAKPGRGTLSEPDVMRKIGRYLPMGHMGEADDVAYAMLYLASEEAR